MTIAVAPDQDLSKVVTSLATARLLGFSTTGRKSTEAPSRRIIALALGLATGNSAAAQRQRRADRGCRVQTFADAVNLALATHGPRNLHYAGGGQLGWDAPAWTLPTTYLVTRNPTATTDGSFLNDTGTLGLQAMATTAVYRVRANTRVGLAQASDIGITGLSISSLVATSATAYEGGSNAANALSVTLAGTAEAEAQVLWQRRMRGTLTEVTFTGPWTDNFLSAVPSGTQTGRSFTLDIPYDGYPGRATEIIPIRCFAALGRAPTETDYDAKAETTMTVYNVAAS